jgi:hypothetical protein
MTSNPSPSRFHDEQPAGRRGGDATREIRVGNPSPKGQPAGELASTIELASTTRLATGTELAGDPELAGGTFCRAFDGDPERLRSFVSVLSAALPSGTMLALRGSAVVGRSFRTGAPFDADGPGTSDLDVVVVGDDARDLFAEEALLLGGINTLPLSDAMPWAAPELDGARRQAQALARRPVSIQAMAGWFLELRSMVQGQPYVILAPDQ